jgi:tRNA pseudouridine55 synthase
MTIEARINRLKMVRLRVARKRKGRLIDGILIVDKPTGMTSNATLQRAKRALFAAKAGHTGSLDPLATGVLPLCFGEATKFSRFLLDADKAYCSTFRLGVTTTTGDADGDVVARCDTTAITLPQVERALAQFKGAITQTPSMYSAIKHEGRPLYQLAREGKEVERKSRTVTIHELVLQRFETGEQATVQLSLRCTKGTYVRSIAEDLGHLLGCGAHVTALRRTASGPFGVEQSVSLEHIEALAEAHDFDELNGLLLPIETALLDLPEVRVPEDSVFYLRQGQPVMVANCPLAGFVRIVADDTGALIGVGESTDDGRLAPRRLINTRPEVA